MIPILTLASLALSCPSEADARWTGHGFAEIEHLARHGDKSAQFEVGQRLRLGIGVPPDLPAAKGWYRRAERTTETRNFIYSGPVGREKHGRALPAGRAIGEIGLPQAGACLAEMEGGR